jgi:DNA processing protein
VQKTAWVALSLLKHVGGKTMRALLAHFGGDLQAVLKSDTRALCEVPGIGAKIAAAIQTVDLEQTDRALRRWQAAGVRVVTWDDPEYPTPLIGLEDAPPTLFLRGAWHWSACDHPFRAAALVGTRSPSLQARITANRLAAHFTREGYTIVSGMALGIDTLAHQATLSHAGITLAVLGSGVLNPYPPENAKLAAHIMQRGALLCEVHPDAPVSTPGLVSRNRIITGLCKRVIVVETEVDGGAMHAARFALAQGREVYVVESEASGNQALLDSGAYPAEPLLEH